MALSDTRAFLEDALIRYDPSVDLTDGSRAQVDLIDPILQRVGPDPFDDDMSVFILNRIQQVYPDLAITEEDALRDTVVDPMRVLMEPIVREVRLIKLRSDLRNIESISDDEVDALIGNFFERRIAGGFALGVVRAYFAQPQSVSVGLTNPASTRGGLRFFTTRPQTITADQMLLNVEGAEYYFDINYTAEQRGTEYNAEANAIVSIANLTTASRVVNLRRFREGAVRETSVEAAARAEASTSDKTLTVARGISRTLREAFPGINTLFTVGFRDPEMRRDVIQGGSLGPIPASDDFGEFYGEGEPVDDVDGDSLTRVMQTTGGSGFFVSRLGAAGSDPVRWFMSISYVDPTTSTLKMVDARVAQVLSSSSVLLDTDLPVPPGVPAVALRWALREKLLTISAIPGGITLPDTAAGELEIRNDEVHVGGRTDVYISGESDNASAQIDGLTDEDPAARGFNAQTDAALAVVVSADRVRLNDSSITAAGVGAGWSLVLEEGVDVGSYLILSATDIGAGVVELLLSQEMTGSQSNLSWRVVDDINTNLMDPRHIKVIGNDLITSAGSDVVTTASSTNFIDTNILADDVVRIEGDAGIDGDYSVVEVSAVTLKLDPAVPRTAGAVSYSIFRRSEALVAPVLRVSGIDLLDSGGSPVGTTVPYRDPVLAQSRSFQNEGSSLSFDGRVRTGMVSLGGTGTFLAVGGLEILWFTFDPIKVYLNTVSSGTFTFPAGPARSVATAVAEFNADASLLAAGVRALEITKDGESYMGFFSNQLILFAGTAASTLELNGISNATVRTLSSTSVEMRDVLVGDAVEILDGANAGAAGRVVQVTPSSLSGGYARIGTGPLGPLAKGAYDNLVLNPEVGVRAKIGRPSVGSARVYFLEPTSAEAGYRGTSFSVAGATRTLRYQPDPENLRTLRPPSPLTELPKTAVVDSGASTLVDASANFLLWNIQPGDVLEVLYRPIDSTAPLPSPSPLAVSGLTLQLQFDDDPAIAVEFPIDDTRQNVADYINSQVGEDVATILGTGELRLQSKARRIEIKESSTALAVLLLTGSPRNSDHPDKGEYTISVVTNNTTLVVSAFTLFPSLTTTPDTQYRILRYVQRISSTEMNENKDATGMYYQDVELRSVGPGNEFNIEGDVELSVTGYRSDGYRLVAEDDVLTFSRAEILKAELSRTILLVGSSDSPEEYVQLNQQNMQINYDRSQLVDSVQSLVDSDAERVVCESMLARHLLPHYVNVSWAYVGGPSKSDAVKFLQGAIDAIEPDSQFEVDDLVGELRRRGSTSLYTVDPEAANGRRGALMVVVYHREDRTIHASIVRDFIDEVRAQRYIPDVIDLTRISSGGIS